MNVTCHISRWRTVFLSSYNSKVHQIKQHFNHHCTQFEMKTVYCVLYIIKHTHTDTHTFKTQFKTTYNQHTTFLGH